MVRGMCVIDVTCERDDDDICKKYHYMLGVWYASCRIARELKKSLDEEEDIPNFEDLPEEFRDYTEDLIEESKSVRKTNREHFTKEKIKRIKKKEDRPFRPEPGKDFPPEDHPRPLDTHKPQ